jgi:GT2 family glycosyltransferase
MMTQRNGSRTSGANTENLPKVAIVILNWNGWKNTVECLESLYQNTYPKYEIILVDNGSKDGSIQKIEEYAEGKLGVESKFFSYDLTTKPLKIVKPPVKVPSDFYKKLVLVENPINYGFVKGVNLGLQLAQKQSADYVLLLNNDIVVDKSFLCEMVTQAEKIPQFGIGGPTIYYYDRPTTIDFAGENLTLWRVKGKENRRKLANPVQVDKIEGSCMLIKVAVLDTVGLLYPKYWAYWEETDLCFRAKKAGFKIVYIPEAKIWHKVASSIGGEGNLKRQYYLNRNRILFAKRNLSPSDQAKFLLYFFGYELWLKVAVELKHRTLAGAFNYLRAGFDGLMLFLDPRNHA